MDNSDSNGLNEYLQPTGSPIDVNQQQLNSITFDASTEANSISQTKIPFFSFSLGQGGTLTLGGVGNGNGQLVVNTAAGAIALSMTNTGIVVSDGTNNRVSIGLIG